MTTPRKRVFSGIQPTGKVHLGNLLGAIENWVRLQDEYECTFCIVDWHAMTVDYDAKVLRDKVRDCAIALLSSGIDPEKATLFVQSEVPEHTELAWYLMTCAPVSRLELQTQYKDKSQQHAENLNAGLLTYPVLQAADILAHRADAVPVGEDQRQHLELARELARKFNLRFGQVFREPETLLTSAKRVLGLDGKVKMSKSKGNAIDVLATPEEVKKLLRSAVTDEQRLRRTDPGRPEVCNVFSWHQMLSEKAVVDRVDSECRSAKIGCADCKNLIHESLMARLGPIRERAAAYYADPARVDAILAEGARKARASAKATLALAREKCGFGPASW